MGWQRGPSLPEAARGQLWASGAGEPRWEQQAPELPSALLGPSGPRLWLLSLYLGEGQEQPGKRTRTW